MNQKTICISLNIIIPEAYAPVVINQLCSVLQRCHVTPAYPSENDYVATATWLEQQRALGIDYYREAGCNRSRMCRQLSDLFGWVVDADNLRKCQNRGKRHS